MWVKSGSAVKVVAVFGLATMGYVVADGVASGSAVVAVIAAL